MASSGSNSWTVKQNKVFENAVAIFDQDTPDRWQKMARFIGGNKTAEDVKRHYDMLEEDVNLIDSGRIPLPPYKHNSSSSTTARSGQQHNMDEQEHRMRYLKLQ
ncbi:protein RADIALIS-like 4 [Impatiens glandulifera]|uniref:protein RADIALIS-like 4 n=1 Tax=Impatiens glandulifera TaxID=253017 RepID=UPI001FB08354|nr:protein RADIALIS-like 4 [Impatiens glandulifera]